MNEAFQSDRSVKISCPIRTPENVETMNRMVLTTPRRSTWFQALELGMYHR